MKAGEKFRFGRQRLEQPIAQTFQVPALRKEREGRGTRSILMLASSTWATRLRDSGMATLCKRLKGWAARRQI